MTESVLDYMTRLGRAAREASRVIGRASTAQKNRALLAAAAADDEDFQGAPRPAPASSPSSASARPASNATPARPLR